MSDPEEERENAEIVKFEKPVRKTAAERDKARLQQFEEKVALDRAAVFAEVEAVGGGWANYAVGERMTTLYNYVLMQESVMLEKGVKVAFEHMRNYKEFNQVVLQMIAQYQKSLVIPGGDVAGTKRVLRAVGAHIGRLIKDTPGLSEDRRKALQEGVSRELAGLAQKLEADAKASSEDVDAE
jgi:hypothetical protein